MQQSSLANFFEQKKDKIKKNAPQMEARICIRRTQDVQGNAT